jgi:hypothetical protein
VSGGRKLPDVVAGYKPAHSSQQFRGETQAFEAASALRSTVAAGMAAPGSATGSDHVEGCVARARSRVRWQWLAAAVVGAVVGILVGLVLTQLLLVR